MDNPTLYRIEQYKKYRDAYELCAGTTEARLRMRSMLDKSASVLEAAGVRVLEIGVYTRREDQTPPAALRVRFAKKAILEDYT